MQSRPKHEPGAIGKAIEAGADIAENLGNAISGLFQVGPAYDPEEEAFIREMKRRQKRKKRQKSVISKLKKVKQEFENSPENYLQNIADDLSSISGTCNEIKETQLNCATTDDLNNLSTSVTSAVTEKVDEMKTSIEKQTKAVGGIGSDLTTTVNDTKTEITEKIDNFTANPPVQKVEKTIRIAKETWQIYLDVHLGVHLDVLRSHDNLAGSPH